MDIPASPVVIVGASGLIGTQVAGLVAGRGVRDTHLLVRRDVHAPAGATVHVADASDWPAALDRVNPAILVCCLGTTISQAGSQAAFESIDYQLVVDLARTARGRGARQMIVISSVGASASSSNFYLRTKGRMESAVSALAFDRFDIFRPGLLLGDRAGPARLGERVGMMIAPITNFLTPRRFDRYRAVDSRVVAKAVVAVIGAGSDGQFIHHNREMHALAASGN